MKIGLFFGSTTCYTEMTAEKIQQILGQDLIDLHNVRQSPLIQMTDYPLLLLGISTWDFGEIQEDWQKRWSELDELDLSGQRIALFGLGDQGGYGEWYLDAMGLLHDKVVERGAQILGHWPNQGYQFAASKALTPDKSHFVGLALDEDSQYDLTEHRLHTWLAQVLNDYQDNL